MCLVSSNPTASTNQPTTNEIRQTNERTHACVQVTAAKETVLARARRRGEITKRVVPDEVLLASLQQVSKNEWERGVPCRPWPRTRP